jgi:hypothetical protein
LYSFSFDESSGILYVKVTGFWSLELAERYVIEQLSHWNEARRRAGCLRLLVDGSESSVQSPEVSLRVRNGRKDMIKSPRDRAAIVVGTNLVRLQTERTIESEQMHVFTSVAEAERWLTQADVRATAA